MGIDANPLYDSRGAESIMEFVLVVSLTYLNPNSSKVLDTR